MGLDDREYHLQRARDELASAHRSPAGAAASAHLRLSVLHMERARLLGDSDRPHFLETVSN